MTPEQILEQEKQREAETNKSGFVTPDAIVAREKSRLANSANGSFYVTRDVQPDRAGKVISLADRIGAQPDFVDKNLETIEQGEEETRRQGLLNEFPKLANYFSDPYRAAEAKDSVPNFAEIERMYMERRKSGKPKGWLEAPFSQAGDLARSAGGEFVNMFGMGVRGAGDLTGAYVTTMRSGADMVPGLREGLAELDRVEGEIAPDAKILAPQNYLRKAGGGVTELGDIIKPDNMGFEDQVAGALGQIFGAVLATVAGGPGASGGLFIGMGADQQGQAMRQAGLNPDEMPLELAAGGAVTGLSEQMRLGSIMRMMPREARQRVAGKVISRILGQAGEEAIQEGTEGVLQNLITTTYDADASLFEGVTEQMTTAGTAAAVFQALVEAALPGKSRGARAEQAAQELTDIREIIEQTPVFQRSRESIETFLNEAGDGETVLLHGEDLVELFQSDPEVFYQRMDEVGLTEEDISRAMDGHDVEVEAAKILSVSEGFEDWVKIAKADEETPTLRELERSVEDSDAMGSVDFTEAFERFAEQDEALEGFERVQSAVTEQLLGAGRGQAEAEGAGVVWGAMFRQLAEAGVDEGAVFERLGLKINEPAAQQADDTVVMNQATESGFEGDNAGEAREWVSAVEKGLDMSQEARLARAAEMGFDTETVVFHGTARSFGSFNPEAPAQTKSGSEGSQGQAVFLTDSPRTADAYARRSGFRHGDEPDGSRSEAYEKTFAAERALFPWTKRKRQDAADRAWSDLMRERELDGGAQIVPVVARLENPMVVNDFETFSFERMSEILERAKAAGHDGVKIENFYDEWGDEAQNYTIIFDPSNIRSVNAAFDPDHSDSANLLAQSAPASMREALRMEPADRAEWFDEEVSQRTDADGTIILTAKSRDDRETDDIAMRIDDGGGVTMRFEGRLERRDNKIQDPETGKMVKRPTTREEVQQSVLAFSRSIAMLEEFVSRENPESIHFTGSDSTDTRNKMYMSLLKRMRLPGYRAFEVMYNRVDMLEVEGFREQYQGIHSRSFYVIRDDAVNRYKAQIQDGRIRTDQTEPGPGQLAPSYITKQLTTADEVGRIEPGRVGQSDGRGSGDGVRGATFNEIEPAQRELFQLAGPRSKQVDKKILKHAKKLNRKRRTRDEIWAETAEMGQPWYKDENGDWITEFEDRSVVVKQEKGKVREVIEYPALYDNYPQIGKQRADARGRKEYQESTGDPDIPGTKGTYETDPAFWRPHVRISDQGAVSAPYTAVHELQHAIDALEKRKNRKRGASYTAQPTERRAFNVMYRHLWTMEERIAIPPWETEQEAIDWFLGNRAEFAEPARNAKDETYDPSAIIIPPDPFRKWQAEEDTEMDNAPGVRGARDLRLEREGRTTRIGGKIYSGRAPGAKDLTGRTFLSVKEAKRNLKVLQDESADRIVSDDAVVAETERRMMVLTERFAGAWGELQAINSQPITEATPENPYPQDKPFDDLMSWAEWNLDDVELDLGANEIAEMLSNYLVRDNGLRNFLTKIKLQTRTDVQYGMRRGWIEQGEFDPDAVLTPNHMIDIDAPLDGQSERVRDVLQKLINGQLNRESLRRAGYDFANPDHWKGLPAGKVLTELMDSMHYEDGTDHPADRLIHTLQAEQIYGALYLPGGKKEDGPPQFQSVLIFDRKANTVTRDENHELLQRQRASVLIPGEGVLSDQDTLVKLSTAADRTSFMHESAHIFLELYAALEGENETIADRMAAVRKWLKIKPGEKITRDQHEKFAESFEAYLMEGVAPSAELRSVFHSFRQWFVDVYRRLRGQLRNLEPEARDIFDRMLASDTEIEMAQGQYVGTLSNVMTGLMRPEQVEKYQKHARKAGNVARDKLFKKHMAEVKARERKAYKEERARVEDLSRQTLMEWPEYKALAAFSEGRRALDVEESPESTKLNTSENGEHPEIVAPEMGFTSADEMFKAIETAHPFDKVLKGAVDQIMGDRYGDMLKDGTIESEAMEAVFNEPTIRMMEAERNALAEKASGQPIPLIAIRHEADRLINTMPIDKVIKPGRYAIKARDLHKKSLRAAARGKWDDALRYTHQAMLQHELARRAFKAREEIEKANRYLAKFAAHRKLDPKKISPEYIAKIRELVSLPGNPEQSAVRDSLNKFADEQALDGFGVILPTDVVVGDDLPIRRRMTMEQFREFRDGVKNLNALGRQQSAEAQEQFNEEAQAIADQIDENWTGPRKRETRNPTAGERVATMARTIDAEIIRWPFLIEALQGGKTGKIIEVMETRLRQALTNRNARRQEMVDKLAAIFKKHGISQAEMNKSISAPVIEAGSVKFEQVLAVALNMGTEQNRDRLVSDPSMSGDMAAIEAMLANHLEQRHWDATQEIWDLINTLWPEASAVERKATGVTPKKVDAASVQTKFGAYRGGYYPLKYDKEFLGNKDIEQKDQIDEWKNGVNGMATRASTNQGFLKERQQNVERPLRLRLGVILSHIDDVTNDIYMREPASYVSRLLQKRRIQKAITETHGREYLRTLETILKRVVTGTERADTLFEKITKGFRINASVAILGHNVVTAGLAPISYFQTVVPQYGFKTVLSGVAEYYSNPFKNAKLIKEKSAFMRERQDTLTREAHELIRKSAGQTIWAKAQGLGYWLMATAEKHSVSGALWVGVYNQSKAEGSTEADAITKADRAVSTTQGSGLEIDQSILQGGNESVRLLTFMWGYVSGYYGTVRNDVARAEGMKKLMPLLKHMIILNTLASMLEAFIRGGFGDEEDPYVMSVLQMMGRNVFGLVPGVSNFVSKYDSGPAAFQVGASATRATENWYKAGTQFYEDGEAEGETVRRAMIESAKTGGFLFGVPGTIQAIKAEKTYAEDDDPTLYEAIVTGPDDDN